MTPELEAAKPLYTTASELAVVKLLYFVAPELLSPTIPKLETRITIRIELIEVAIIIGVATIGAANTIEVVTTIKVVLITSTSSVVAEVVVTFLRAKRVTFLKEELETIGVSSNSVAYLGKFSIRLFYISISIELRYL